MIITISSKAGGVGKTTIASNIAAKLSLTKKVLLLDLDFKSNISLTFGKDPFNYIGNSFLSVIQNKKTIDDIIDKDINQSYKDFKQKNPQAGELNIIYSEPDLKKYDNFFDPEIYDISIIENIFNNLNKIYDFIIIDTPNELDRVTTFALTHSDKIIIPFEPKIFTWKSSFDIIQFLEKHSNPKGNIPIEVFVLPNKYNESLDADNKYLALAKEELAKYPQSKFYIFHFVAKSIPFTANIAESIDAQALPFVFDQKDITEWEHLKDLFENAL